MTSILNDAMGQTITLRNITTVIDADGKQTSQSVSEVSELAVITYITQEDDDLVVAGFAKIGDAKIYMEHDSGLEHADEVEDASGDVWRVIKIFNKPEAGGFATEIHGLMRRSHSR